MSENDSNDFVEEEMLLFVLLLRRSRRRRRAANRTNWCRPWLARRLQQGVLNNLVKEIDAEDPVQFRLFHRLDRQSYESILAMVYPYIQKQNTIMRSSVSPRERLSVSLRFLATGRLNCIVDLKFVVAVYVCSPRNVKKVNIAFDISGESFQSLSMQFRLRDRTISDIVDETCQALYITMKETSLKVNIHLFVDNIKYRLNNMQ